MSCTNKKRLSNNHILHWFYALFFERVILGGFICLFISCIGRPFHSLGAGVIFKCANWDYFCYYTILSFFPHPYLFFIVFVLGKNWSPWKSFHLFFFSHLFVLSPPPKPSPGFGTSFFPFLFPNFSFTFIFSFFLSHFFSYSSIFDSGYRACTKN